MDNAYENVLINATEFIPGRLYFVSLNTDVRPKSTTAVHYFGIDAELNYDNFYLDFGPLNLAMLYHYCVKLRRKLNNPTLSNKKIVHFTGNEPQKRVNAAFLIGAYSIIYFNFTPEQAYSTLIHESTEEYLEFRDASLGEPYTLSLLNCLRAIKKALTYGFFNFDNFDFLEYEHYERVENGDFNWIVPNKFIAFCGPHNRSKLDKGYPIHSPETYFAYFRRHKVTTIIRLNKRAYDSNRFVNAGFDHKDLYFVDGGTPCDRILNEFIQICENAKGAIAVHCKAGLGRTGSLIACYIMKHYKFTAKEAIAWIRICRPGSIIGHQQSWLQEKQKEMWEAGELYRKKHRMKGPIKHTVGIYSLSTMNRTIGKSSDNVTGIVKKVDCMEITDSDEFPSEENKLTQGDKLNEIKAQRTKAKPLGSNLSDLKTLKTKVTVVNNSTVVSPTILRGGKILSNSVRTAGSTSTRVLTKRIDTKDSHSTRRTSQRKINAIISSSGPTSTTTTTDKLVHNELKRPLRKTKESPWFLHKNLNNNNNCTINVTLSNMDSSTSANSGVKRSKRTLTLEKDSKANSPRSVKVLRRSYVPKICEKSDKLRLPSVKINKTL